MEIMERIPNNVGLSSNKRLQRALEAWLPNYLDWWREAGPIGFQAKQIYLRTATSVEPGGWACFDHVQMPEYRWGIFLAPPVSGRTIACGDDCGSPVWQEVPSEFRPMLWRLIAMQGDTEPASVEQQRRLGETAPSLYDLRSLFQVNVEEGRHLWAMVYLLQRYFGADGEAESAELLARRSGAVEKPRILSTFNQPIENWLDFFMFTMFADRDGKYQLSALAESAFDPLARTAQFMCTEEAYHLCVGENGLDRIVARTAALLRQGRDVVAEGAIPLDMIQRYINHWFPLCLDLFGRESSSNAAEFFATGLKGRFKEGRYPDHVESETTYRIVVVEDGQLIERAVPLRRAMNEILRDEYIEDCQRAVNKWNRTLKRYGQNFTFRLPHRRFHRQQSIYAGTAFDLDGSSITPASWGVRQSEWLPSSTDRVYVQSIMHPVYNRGQVANWIAAPTRGINGQPIDYDYVRL